MKLVMIEWLDAHSLAKPGWNRLDEAAEGAGPIRVRSVGWLASTAGKCKTLVSHVSGESDGVVPYVKGDLTIPNRNIVKMTVLRGK